MRYTAWHNWSEAGSVYIFQWAEETAAPDFPYSGYDMLYKYRKPRKIIKMGFINWLLGYRIEPRRTKSPVGYLGFQPAISVFRKKEKRPSWLIF